MARKTGRLRMDEIPIVLRPLISVTATSEPPTTGRTSDRPSETYFVGEKEYYVALEKYLATMCTANGDTDAFRNDDADGAVVEEGAMEENATSCRRGQIDRETLLAPTAELETYHLQNLLRVDWLFDHEAHERHSYYPSNLFPIGSNEEYSFFTRAWTRNVNYPYARRLYERGGRFDVILNHVPSRKCPCSFLMVFNVTHADVWRIRSYDTSQCRDDDTLSRLEVENELLFRSDFFHKRNPNKLFANTNRWVYETFVRPHHEREPDTAERVVSNAGVTTTTTTAPTMSDGAQSASNVPFCGDSRRGTREPESDTAEVGPSSSSSPEAERQRRMLDILNALYFGERFVRENDRLDFNDRLLARCEDYRSYLYSPLLNVNACKHETEEVTFVQRRSGDEIATELRKCKACGRVKAN